MRRVQSKHFSERSGPFQSSSMYVELLYFAKVTGTNCCMRRRRRHYWYHVFMVVVDSWVNTTQFLLLTLFCRASSLSSCFALLKSHHTKRRLVSVRLSMYVRRTYYLVRRLYDALQCNATSSVKRTTIATAKTLGKWKHVCEMGCRRLKS